MKKIILSTIFIFFCLNSFAHIGHYNNLKKIEMDILLNDELIGYNYYFFSKKANNTIITNQFKFKVKVLHLFVKTNNILKILPKKLGILSIDIDGNDYWILKEILSSKSNIEMIVVEYNASFLDKSITVPYDENFNRHSKHKSGMYHGASLKAFIKLLNSYNYCLINTTGGINAFFLKKKLLTKFDVKEINFEKGYQENFLRNAWSNTTAKDQFKKISHLDYIYL